VTSIGSYAFSRCEALSTVYTDSEYVAEWFAENMPEVTVRPLSGGGYDDQPLSEADAIVTGEDVTMFTSGNVSWFLQEDIFHSAPSAMQSGAIGHDGASTLTARVTGPGVLSFYWKVSSESGWDFLSFSVDGAVQESISGETDWVKSGYVLSEGEHKVSWTYAKDYAYSGGEDCGWVDDIVWPDASYVPPNCVIDGIRYYIENGEASVTGVSSTSIATANILAEVAGCPVTSIGEKAFYGCDNLTNITIPEGVTNINDYAFDSCDKLTSVYLPQTLTSLGEGVFAYCGNLEELVVAEGNDDFVVVDGVLFNADMTRLIVYPAGKAGDAYVIPDTVTVLDNYSFTWCDLTSVHIPNSVVSIGSDAFWSCDGLTSIMIPESVTGIGERAFGACGNLTEIVVSEDNKDFVSVDGVLFNADGTRLIAYPAGKVNETYAVPATVTHIDSWGFFTCKKLTDVFVPYGVSYIGNQAFDYCTNLTSIIISNGVTEIGYSAFNDSFSLKTVFTDNEYVMDWFYYNMPTVSIRPLSEYGYDDDQPLPEADAIVIGEGVTMSTSGNAPWFLQEDIFHSAPSAMQSGAIDHDGGSTLTARVIGPGVLSFYWKVSSESGYDFLSFSVDGVVQESISGEKDWVKSGYALGEGAHEVSWTYAKDYMDDYESDDCGWVDDIVWPDNDYVPAYIVSGGIRYHIEDGVATAVGLQDMSLAEITIPSEVNGHAVVAIGDDAFNDCDSLTSVVISDGVTSIGNYAFAYCGGLQHVTLPSSLTSIGNCAFMYASRLVDVNLLEGLISIGVSAFLNCQLEETVTIPASLTYLGGGALSSSRVVAYAVADGNTVFTVQDGVLFNAEMTSLLAYPRARTDATYTVPDMVTSIGSNAFDYNDLLQRVILPEGVDTINSGAFCDCSALESINIPSSVTMIGNWAFRGCARLDGLILPAGLQDLGMDVFEDCTSLTSMNIPNGITYISRNLFRDCSSLERVVIGSGVSDIWMETNSYGDLFHSFTGAALVQAYTDNEFMVDWFAKYMPDVEVLPLSEYGDDENYKPLPEADAIVTGEGVTMSTSVAAPWFLQEDIFHSAPSAMQSGAIGHDGVSTLTARVTGPGMLSFYWRVSSEAGYDMLSVSVDGELRGEISGESSWRQMNCYLESGKHVIEWAYSKDYSVSIGNDCGWIDDIVLSQTELKDVSLHGGELADNETWEAGQIHIVQSLVTVPEGKTLTVDPGAIVKFMLGGGIRVHGNLEALGNRAQPIVFTSINDDEHGGDTNGDGNKTMPQAGDWTRIYAFGNINMNYVTISYLNNTDDCGAIQGQGGTVVFANGVIEHSAYECVRMNSGTFLALNSIFRESSMGFGYFGGAGTLVYNCVIADVTVGCRASNKHFTNCIFYRVNTFTDQGGDSSSFKNCVFYNPPGYGAQSYNKCGYNGNFWADPLFTDPDNGDFTLASNSPCIDAGDGENAPELDYFGQPRQDIREIADTGTAAANGAVPDIGIHEALPKNAAANVDLAISDLELSHSELEIGQEVTISWTVANLGNQATDEVWRDRVYLVTASKDEIELGNYLHEGILVPDGSETVTRQFRIPIVQEGYYRIRVCVNNDRNVFEGTLTDNNVLESEEVSCHLSGIQDGSYHGEVHSGENFLKFALGGRQVNVGRIRVPENSVILLGNAFMPDMSHYDTCLTADVEELLFEIPEGCETLYLLIQAPQDGSCELEMFQGDLQIGSVQPNVLPCSGRTSMMISGVGLHDVVSVKATSEDGRTSVAAKSVRQISAEQLLATFDCAELSAGAQYGLQIATEASLASKPGAFAVGRQNGEAKLVARLVVPDTVRLGRTYLCSLVYENVGNIDVMPPIFELEVQGEGTVGMADGEQSKANLLALVGAGNARTAGVIRPGESFAISFQYTAGAGDKVILRSSIDKDYYAQGWSSALEFSQNVSDAAYRIGARGQDATNYKTVTDLAAKLRDGVEFGGAIYGKLLDGGKAPVPKMPMSVYADEACETLVGATSTSAHGVYCFADLVPGTYYLVPVCIPQRTSDSYLAKNRHEVVVGGDEDVNVDIELEGTLSIRGLIDDDEEYVVKLNNFSSGDQLTLMARNTFAIYGLEPGWYRLELSNDRKGENRWLDFSDGETIVLRFAPSGKYTLSGAVENYEEFRDELEFAIVRAEAENGDAYLARLDSNGGFAFADLIAGKYELMLTNCACVAMAEIDLQDDLAGVALNAQPYEPEPNNGLDVPAANALATRSTSLWDEFWGTYADVCSRPFYWAADQVHKLTSDSYQQMNLEAVRLIGTYKVYPPEGVYDCEHNRRKYNQDKSSYEVFVLKQKAYNQIVRGSDPWLAIAESSKLVSTVADVAFDYYLLKADPISKVVKWKKIALELLINLRKSQEALMDFYDFINQTGQNVGNGKLELADFGLSAEDVEWTNTLGESLGLLTNAVKGATTTAEKVEAIAKLIQTGKRVQTMIHGITNNHKLLMARGYVGYNRLSTCLSSLSLVGDLITMEEQARKAVYEITTCLLSLNKLDDMFTQMTADSLAFITVARDFNKYTLCCNMCVPPPDIYEETDPDLVQSCDPNEMAGLYGFGDGATQRFVQPGEEMTYTIYFENKAEATAAAQEVRVTSELSKWLDWSTFKVAEIGFRNQIDTGLAGKSAGISESSLAGTTWKVRSEVELNRETGVVSYYLRIVDETTADGWPDSAYDGFLPPNDDNHSGEGYIRYKVCVRDDAPIVARLDAMATIIFDYNAPITTSPAWFNWVGAEDSSAAMGYLTWDEVEEATYAVTIWTGDADLSSEKAEVVAESGELSKNRWRLPGGLTDGVTYYWQVTVIDKNGQEKEGLVYSFELGGRASYELHPGWNLLSLPFALDSYSLKQLLKRRVMAVEDEAFVHQSSLELGRAYWLYLDATDEPWLDFLPAVGQRDEATEPPALEVGWNAVGPLDTDTVFADDCQVWHYENGGWHLLEKGSNGFELKAGQGYMIYCWPKAE